MRALSSLADLLSHAHQDRLAIAVPDTQIRLSYRELRSAVNGVCSCLKSQYGIVEGDAIAMALPNSLEFVAAFLATTSIGCKAAPLNPAYKVDEFLFYLDDLKARVMIVPRGGAPLAREAAMKSNSKILEISFDSLTKTIQLTPPNSPPSSLSPSSSSSSFSPSSNSLAALILHTSGTTSRPKAVPLSHSNLVNNIQNIISTYHLTENDKTFIVMPLFHVHGLIGVLLTTLATGGLAVIPPKFSSSSFWKQFGAYQCTWYSAVPTIHQMLLSTESSSPSSPSDRQYLKFIRSCSSSLAPATFEALKNKYGVPIVEAYAMTEASHQMTSNPCPPSIGPQKAGSVGFAHGKVQVSVRAVDADVELKQGEIGEICVRGANVMNGYINNDEANRTSFTQSKWFRTGDQGYVDKDGYLFLSGRLKELINRGGEKISPLEIDAVLLQHAQVAEAVAFPAPSAMYGQEVMAAVVLKASNTGNTNKESMVQELQKHCGSRMASFKVPKNIFITNELPKTSTGKIQRRHVATYFLEKQPVSKL